MNLSLYVENLRQQLAVAADAGGDDARKLAERLTAPLESAARLVMLEVLSAAADEITREMAPGSVEVRLRGSDPGFVVTLPPVEDVFEDADGPAGPGSSGTVPATGGLMGGRERNLASQPPPARRSQTTHRRSGPSGGTVAQRLAGSDGRRRARAEHPGSTTSEAERAGWPEVRRLGEVTVTSFDTPDPISVTIEVPLGQVHLIAAERAGRPGSASSPLPD